MKDNTEWHQKMTAWALSQGYTPEQLAEMKPKLTLKEQSAQRQAEMDAVVYQPMTIARLRSNQERHTRAVYTAAGYEPHDVERFTSAHMETVTDEALIESWKEAGRDIAARKAAEAAQWAKDQEAKKANAKVKRDHEDRLAREKAATAEAIEEAEVWEKRAKTLEGQFSALMTAQKTGGR